MFVLPTVVMGAAFLALLPDSLDRSVWAILGRPRDVQPRRRGAHRRRRLGASAPRPGGRRGHARRVAVARVPPRHPAAAPAGAHRRRRDRVPVHVHVVRRDPRPRRRRPRDDRGRGVAHGRRSSARSGRRPSSPLAQLAVLGAAVGWSATSAAPQPSPSHVPPARAGTARAAGAASASSSVSVAAATAALVCDRHSLALVERSIALRRRLLDCSAWPDLGDCRRAPRHQRRRRPARRALAFRRRPRRGPRPSPS